MHLPGLGDAAERRQLPSPRQLGLLAASFVVDVVLEDGRELVLDLQLDLDGQAGGRLLGLGVGRAGREGGRAVSTRALSAGEGSSLTRETHDQRLVRHGAKQGMEPNEGQGGGAGRWGGWSW